MTTKSKSLIMENKIFAWLAAATGLILLVPLVAMQFSAEVSWTRSDFVVMGALLFGMGSLFILAARKIRTTTHRIIVGVVVLLAVVYLWAELAVGLFTNWGS